MKNLFANLPMTVSEELVDVLAQSSHVRIERIVSTGQASPSDFWYDQDEHEWVVVLRGSGTLHFEDGEQVAMAPGDHVMIAAHRKHRVQWTEPGQATVWLAVFFQDS